MHSNTGEVPGRRESGHELAALPQPHVAAEVVEPDVGRLLQSLVNRAILGEALAGVVAVSRLGFLGASQEDEGDAEQTDDQAND